MQGRLRQESFEVEIQSECACCGRELTLTFGTDLSFRVHQEDATPLVFEPKVDWAQFDEPNIIHRY